MITQEIMVITTAMLTFKVKGTHWTTERIVAKDGDIQTLVQVFEQGQASRIAYFSDVHAIFFSASGELVTGADDG